MSRGDFRSHVTLVQVGRYLFVVYKIISSTFRYSIIQAQNIEVKV